MKNTVRLKVRLERQPHREALRRLREALRKAQQAGLKYEEPQAEIQFSGGKPCKS
jgi:hypothetical protein